MRTVNLENYKKKRAVLINRTARFFPEALMRIEIGNRVIAVLSELGFCHPIKGYARII